MPSDLVVPQLGESITEAEVLDWRRADGDAVELDEIVVELETDKTTVELPAPAAGILRILKEKGSVVAVGEAIARIEEGGPARSAKAAKGSPAATAPPAAAQGKAATSPAAQAAPAAPPPPSAPAAPPPPPSTVPPAASSAAPVRLGPAARRAAEEQGIDPAGVAGSGPGARVTKADIAAAADARRKGEDAPARAAAQLAPAAQPASAPAAEGGETRVRMTRLRRTIAERLVAAQHTAAILTTFNEIDMSGAMALRARHKEAFEKKHGVSLGFMSIFARSCVLALRDVPLVGARLEGDEIVTSERVHLGIAASTDRGLVVPVVRDADRMTLADLEREIGRLAALARSGELTVEDLSGGTFTISNGGVFGSLLSTPILNPPQSGILGMHKIEKRPVVVDDQVVVRPMMYVALSYDHRLIDGRDAVTFLVRVKERVEDPARLLLEI